MAWSASFKRPKGSQKPENEEKQDNKENRLILETLSKEEEDNLSTNQLMLLTKRSLSTNGVLESHLQRGGSGRSGRRDGKGSSAGEGGKDNNEVEHF